MGLVYSDEQKNAIDYGMNYGFQANPWYDKTNKWYKQWMRGGPKAEAMFARHIAPLRTSAGIRKNNAIADYGRAMAPGVGEGGAAQLAAGSARIGREYDSDLGMAEVAGHSQFGEGLRSSIDSMFENAKGRELSAYQTAAGIQPTQQTGFWEKFALAALGGASTVAGAYAGRPPGAGG
jgi:hypothetical protein